MNMPLVSVIILTWKRLDDLLETIAEVKRGTYKNIEIIVVDNASFDGTEEIIKKQYPEIRLFCLPENIGIAGYNVGMKEAKGEYIVLLDSDSFPEKDCIEKMVSCFEQTPDLGVAAFDVRNYEYRNKDIHPADHAGHLSEIAATGYNGAGVGIRKECLRNAGYLYEPFFLYMNEQDHSLRILKSGYKIILFPGLIAYHKQSPVGRSNERMAYFYTRNLLWLIWRNFPLPNMIISTLKIFFLCSLYTLILKEKVYIKAVTDAISGISHVAETRSPIGKDIMRRVRIPLNLAFTVYG